jgi:hypothetical protein
MEEALRRLVAESDIRRVLFRYCRGVDRLDEELVRSCYHADATDTHANFSGTVDEFIPWVFRVLPRFEVTMHFLGNIGIEFVDTDRALVETYAMAVHRRPDGEPKDNLLTGFRYVDDFERRVTQNQPDGEWRIARRVVVAEWLRVDDAEYWFPIHPDMIRGQRNKTDTVYTLIDD